MSAPMPAPQVVQSDHRACNAYALGWPDGAEVAGASGTYGWGGTLPVIGAGACRHVALPSLYVYQVPFRGGDPACTIVATAMSSKSLSCSTEGQEMQTVPPVPPVSPAPPPPASGTRLPASHAPSTAVAAASITTAVRPIANLLT